MRELHITNRRECPASAMSSIECMASLSTLIYRLLIECEGAINGKDGIPLPHVAGQGNIDDVR